MSGLDPGPRQIAQMNGRDDDGRVAVTKAEVLPFPKVVPPLWEAAAGAESGVSGIGAGR